MYLKKVVLFLICLWVVTIPDGDAQKRKLEYSGFFDSYYYRGPLSYTAGFGVVAYNGDLCGGLGCNTLKYVYSLGLNYKVWPRTVFGAEFSYFNLQAKDQNATRNISFISTNYELDLYGRLYLLEDIVRVAADRKRAFRKLKPYIHLGIGGLYYNPVSTNGPTNDSIYLHSEGKSYPGITFVIPGGLGLSYSFSHRVSLLGEFTYKYTFSDYLDDVGAVRGNTQGLKDSYAMFNIKLQVSPTAPKLKKRKKFSGGAPSGGGGGESDAVAEPPAEKQPEVKPEGGQTPAPPAQEPSTPEQPAPEQPTPETPQEGQPQDAAPIQK